MQVLELIFIQIITIVQGPIEIFGQHLLVEALTRQTPGRIPAGKVLVRPAGPVEIAAGGDVVDFAAHGEVDGLAGLAVVLEQRAGRVGLEDDGGGAFGQRGGRRRAQAVVGEQQEEREQDEVDGCCDRCAGASWVVSWRISEDW
jgi:hypothetical protein